MSAIMSSLEPHLPELKRNALDALRPAFEVEVVNPRGLEVFFQFFAHDAADPDAAVFSACTRHGFQPHNACMNAVAPLWREKARSLRPNNRSKRVHV